MASVCGGDLAMMDAVTSVHHVARRRRHGSLILPDGDADEPILLTDIRGIEDGLDFKGA